jgi:chromosome condensin MukBEF MukE localization factor
MEHQDHKGKYSFLAQPNVEKYFADINSKLLSGKHIQKDDYYVFTVLEEEEHNFASFYEQLYGLKLTYGVYDLQKYFYLDLFTGGHQRAEVSKYRTLTEIQTIIGLMLLNMYYSKYFQDIKMVKWSEIHKEITLGEMSHKYQRILFEQVKEEYTTAEWANVEKNFKNTINSFQELGWVKKHSQQFEELRFEINACIHRLASLYQAELSDFSAFSEKISNWREE